MALVALAAAGCSSGGGAASPVPQPPPGTPTKFQSAGNAKISASAKGVANEFRIVVRATDRKTGAPVRGANVTVYGEMSVPHFMVLMTRNLHETSGGTYQGPYTFNMPGTWAANIVLRTRSGDASTALLPITVGR